MFAEQILRMVAGLLVGIWVARYLGPTQFGVFSYAIAFTALFGSIAKLGLDNIVVRDLVRDPSQRDLYMGTAFWLKLMGAVVMLGVMALAVQVTSNDATINLYIFIIASGAVFQAFEVVDFYFQSKVLSKFVSICKLAQLFISSLFKLYLIHAGAELTWFVAVALIDQVTLSVSLYIAYRYQKIGAFYHSFDWPTAKLLLGSSWPMIISGIVLMIQSRIDQIIIKEMIGNTEVGYYSSALRVVEVFNFIPVVLLGSFFPAIVSAKSISVHLYEDRLFYLYRLMMLLFLIIAVPVYFFGNEIVVFLYGEAYAPAGALLSLMVLRLFFANYGVARGSYLMTENLIKYSMMTMMLGAVVNVVSNMVLIPLYQSKGAIVASFISFFATTFAVDFIYYRTRHNFFMMLKSMSPFHLTGKKS